ncbi:relaxase/mobilization nuclease domain-containing protein [Psychroserpens algicola]|uniref:Relaxase/mobilization nuclease domain-containing protein n=1 Tax=Psychroserpens algicola TaxID=1719034 RepID=A0ABT0H3V5_9FLAO|nr:relaxase/mobilization nuclease domain-containing protein [Psychroserpens algicola]MCK8479055.1 relaxase/mobilization nuclease domain-containing protein [Psychroserpens algicola]
MIIKSKSIKSKKALRNTIRYILTKDDQNDVGFTMNRYIRLDRQFEKVINSETDQYKRSVLLNKRIENIIDSFESNESKRLIKRKNANRAYHEIISFHKEDTKHLPKKVLLKIARKYAKERAPSAMVISSMHSDKEHLHIHNVISALEFATGKPIRLTRKEFKEVKTRMETWQDKELGLTHSKVNHSKKKVQMLQLDIERELNLRGKRSERQQIQMKLIEVFSKQRSEKVHYSEFEKAGLKLYSRDGKIVGVHGIRRRYRLKTLGFEPERITIEKTRTQNRLQNLKQQQSKRDREQDMER